MDGNGRWAKNKGLPRIAGHKAGVKVLKNIINKSCELNIKFLTLYAFSSENVNLNQGAAEGQNPPTFAGTTPGETATGGDGQQYSWINGEWVNTNEQNQTQQGGTVYNTVPSSNVGDSIVVNTGSGLTYYTWSPETNSYIEQSSGSNESIDKP